MDSLVEARAEWYARAVHAADSLDEAVCVAAVELAWCAVADQWAAALPEACAQVGRIFEAEHDLHEPIQLERLKFM